jgi:hypothetical protein
MMAISTQITKIIANVDKILKSNGLYSDVTYKETKDTQSTYDPITGTYATSSSTSHTFQGVMNTEGDSSGASNGSSGTVQLIILPLQIAGLFELAVDQVFIIDNVRWQIASFNTAPADSVHTVNLRRK